MPESENQAPPQAVESPIAEQPALAESPTQTPSEAPDPATAPQDQQQAPENNGPDGGHGRRNMLFVAVVVVVAILGFVAYKAMSGEEKTPDSQKTQQTDAETKAPLEEPEDADQVELPSSFPKDTVALYDGTILSADQLSDTWKITITTPDSLADIVAFVNKSFPSPVWTPDEDNSEQPGNVMLRFVSANFNVIVSAVPSATDIEELEVVYDVVRIAL